MIMMKPNIDFAAQTRLEILNERGRRTYLAVGVCGSGFYIPHFLSLNAKPLSCSEGQQRRFCNHER